MAVSDTTVQRAYAIICSREGGYTSINKNDNGAVSIGRLQWHGNRALELLKSIISNITGLMDLSSSMAEEIMSPTTDWKKRTFTAEEAEDVRGILKTATSIEQQDYLAKRDISGYMSTLQGLGVTEDNALIFMADIYNQRPASAHNIISNAQGTDIDSLYASASVVFSDYMTRRAQVYRQLMGYDYSARPSQSTEDTADESLPPIDNTAEGVEFITGKLPELGGDDTVEKLAFYLSAHKTELNHVIESIYAKINSVKPYDSGKKNGWEWRRYNDGTVECWRTYDCEDVKCNTAWGSMYISADYGGLRFPFAFARRPSVWLSLSSENRGYLLGYPNGEGATTVTSTGLWWFARGSTSSVGETVRVDIFVRGRTK